MLGEKGFGRDIKIEKCTFRLIRLIKKSNFWKFSFFFNIFRILNKQLPCLAKKFLAGLSELKIAVFVSKDQSENQFSGISLFFQLLQNFERTITVLGKKVFVRHIEIEICSLRLIRLIKKSNFWKFSFFFNFFRILNEQLPCLAKKFSAGLSELKIAVFVSKDQSENQFSEISLFFQLLQNFERTITVLGKKVSVRHIEIESCSLRLIRSMKKSNFWKFSFFSKSSQLWKNNYRAWRKTFRQGYQNWKLQSSSRKIKQKIKFLKNLFFLNFQKSERTFTVLGEKVLGRGIKIANCTLSLQSIMLRIKIIFESFVSFPFIRTWNKTFLGLWQQSFQPRCQKGILGVYMSPLWDVGIRSDMTWREHFFESWRKIFDLFLKTAFYVSRGTFWVKNFSWKFCFFLKLFGTLNEHLLCLARKILAGISKLKNALFVS